MSKLVAVAQSFAQFVGAQAQFLLFIVGFVVGTTYFFLILFVMFLLYPARFRALASIAKEKLKVDNSGE